MSKTILITGTSSGFGKLITQTLLNNGHRVISTMRQPDGKNAAAAEEIRSYGNESNLLIAELDVTQDTSVNNAVEKAIDQFGTIDVLINNAGIGNGGISEGFTTEQFQKLMDVNVTGVHRVTRAVLPAMRKNEQGLIINISSVMGRIV
ncbi:MAG: SDR family NAD(P)-dependent oxidoreductase, partial [Fulvivirga sp.]|nr:SDR family NAD(P)-dependent oxidoreductase [Fulvivirga sp.]